MHESYSGDRKRFTIRVLNEGTDKQRLSVSTEYWVENEGFRKVWCIFNEEETAQLAWALNRPMGITCHGCEHYIESPLKTMGNGRYDDDDRMFCDAGPHLVEIKYPDMPACQEYKAKAIE